MDRAERQVNWLVFAREYVAMKWPKIAPNSRRNTARALTNATLALVTGDRGRPADADLRKALTAWAFNLRTSSTDTPPDHIARALTWLERNTRDVGDLEKPAVARAVLDALTVTNTGAVAAAATVQRQRGVVVNLAEYAVERRLLAQNPITSLSWKAPRTVQSVDRRVVVNPDQARALLDAVAAAKPSGDRLVAFFGAMYYAALRPGEAAMLRNSNISLPADGWGELLLESSTPEAGAS
jgi:site-specific recombinase XerC